MVDAARDAASSLVPDPSSMLRKMTAGLNLDDRDDRRINEPVNLAFGDVIAEPDACHGLDGAWKTAFVSFSFVKKWVYSLLAAILGVPIAMVWGLVFSLITFAVIWIITPLMRVFNIAFSIIRRLVATFCTTFIEPLFVSIGAVLSQIKMRHATGDDGRHQVTDTLHEIA